MAKYNYNPRLPLVGDPSPIMPPVYTDENVLAEIKNKEFQGENVEELLEGMTDEQLFNTALAMGQKLTDLIGIKHCYEHVDMLLLAANSKATGLKYSTDIKWCLNCFQYWRVKKTTKK